MNRRDFLKSIPGLMLIPVIGVNAPNLAKPIRVWEGLVDVVTDPGEGVTIHECGIFGGAGGVLLDRTVFSYVNLNSGDELRSTYTITPKGR